jgi:hypothetical protein
MSPPTSAPLVKMPPPRRAKIEISEAPKPSATSASMTVRCSAGIEAHHAGRIVVAGDAEQGEAATSMPVMAPALKATVEARPGLGGLRGAHVGAHRDVHADEAGERPTAPRRWRSRSRPAESQNQARRPEEQTTTPTMAMVVYWRLR